MESPRGREMIRVPGEAMWCRLRTLQEESGMMRLADTAETKKALAAEFGTSEWGD